MANNLRRPHHEHKALNTLFDKDNLLLFLLVYIIYSVTLYRGQNGNGAVLVFTDQCTLGGTGP